VLAAQPQHAHAGHGAGLKGQALEGGAQGCQAGGGAVQAAASKGEGGEGAHACQGRKGGEGMNTRGCGSGWQDEVLCSEE